MKTSLHNLPAKMDPTYFLSACILVLILGSTTRAVDLAPGDLIICDGNGGSPGKIIKVDPVTGDQTLIAEGGFLDSPFSVAIEPTGKIVVTDLRYDSGGPSVANPACVIRIDPATGLQQVVSEGLLMVDPRGILVSPTGQILVAEMQAADGNGAIIAIDPNNGAQSIYASGSNIEHPWDLAYGPDGSLYVVCTLHSNYASVIKISTDGTQSIISPGGPYSVWVGGLTVAQSGDIYTSDIYYNNAIIKVDPTTGIQSILTQYGPFEDPRDLVVDLSGRLAVVDENVSSPGKVIIVDTATGTPTVLTEGELLVDPYGIALMPTIPPPTITVKIDIDPAEKKNSINLKSKAKLLVAILGTQTFSATEINTETLLFGDPDSAGDWVAPEKVMVEDVNRDHRKDLLLLFRIQDLVESGALAKSTTRGSVAGYTQDGNPIVGEDSVRIVPSPHR